jgi:Mn-dependent DtxR family transcriptional regulator
MTQKEKILNIMLNGECYWHWRVSAHVISGRLGCPLKSAMGRLSELRRDGLVHVVEAGRTGLKGWSASYALTDAGKLAASRIDH